jgi:beta-carotene 15,15'-dioxygenase
MTSRELRRYGLGLLACLPLWAMGRDVLDLAAVIAIALVGTPHGAADVLRLRALATGPEGIVRGLPLLLAHALYLAAAAAVWWLFMRWPAPSLLGFVLISLLHFATTDAQAEAADLPAGRAARVFAMVAAAMAAIVAIAAPFVAWQAQVQLWLRWLGMSAAQAAAFPAPWAAAAVVAAALLACALTWSIPEIRKSRRLPTALCIVAPSLWLPPAAGFAVYFCLVHASRHWSRLQTEQLRLRPGPVVAAMLATLSIALALLWRHEAGAFAPRLVQVVVVGLAALTVPHMLLDALARRRGAN